ncbi:hypothetical protein PDIG_14470 [Penicillium digitatum PHI26]|uniref:Uncharacterized protein n=2 Tax=Penicillium digitatum TaxID=36651 RepID=K9G6D8_PEND2|nr:hypothetical protein PDIP_01960 [Penicillium digitatum Pd1]EKV17495.1 hypothetical protein PDIG_14470 [Penicillium digitatum PHI26]EKV21881.1 hypothetical protein PDIP_01960 [Penicillium digitatum Pd1]
MPRIFLSSPCKIPPHLASYPYSFPVFCDKHALISCMFQCH